MDCIFSYESMMFWMLRRNFFYLNILLLRNFVYGEVFMVCVLMMWSFRYVWMLLIVVFCRMKVLVFFVRFCFEFEWFLFCDYFVERVLDRLFF